MAGREREPLSGPSSRDSDSLERNSSGCNISGGGASRAEKRESRGLCKHPTVSESGFRVQGSGFKGVGLLRATPPHTYPSACLSPLRRQLVICEVRAAMTEVVSHAKAAPRNLPEAGGFRIRLRV